MSRHHVCSVSEIPRGQRAAFRVNDQDILVFHLDQGFYATQSRCTHMFMSLKKGKLLDSCTLQCPLHRACFDVRTGAVVKWANFPPGVQLLDVLRAEKPLKTYPVVIEGEAVFVEV